MCPSPALLEQVEPIALDEPQGHGQEKHLPELDGLRGIAAVAVVFAHTAGACYVHSSGRFRSFLFANFSGAIGVDVFFALSGFLITGILLRKRTRPRYYRNFYARRVLRLAPPYLLILLLVAWRVEHSGAFLALSACYLANCALVFHVPMSYPPLWSLSVEEQFYLLWPTLVRFVSRTRLLVLSAALCVITPLLRVYASHHGDVNFYLPWLRFDEMAWGAMLACVADRARSKRIFGGFAGLSGLAILALVAAWPHGSMGAVGPGLVPSAAAMLTTSIIAVAATGSARFLAPLRSRFLRFFGEISYWLYLIHYLVLYQVVGWIGKRAPDLIHRGGIPLWVTLLSIVFGLSVASGVLVRRFIELPALRLKSRF